VPTSQVQEQPSDLVPAAPPAGPAAYPATLAAPLRSVLAGPVVAVVAVASALVATGIAGLPLRDPGWVTVRRLSTAVAIVLAFVLLDALVRARRPSPRAVGRALRAKWTRQRVAIVALAVLCFHVTYLAYRNIKSVAPLLRPGDVFDARLMDLERSLFGGRDPGVLLHDLLGTGASAHGLAWVYMAFFTFIPVVLAAALVFAPDLRAGLHLATALSLTWLLGAGSYLVLPSIGPFHWDPAAFASLPITPVRELQDTLIAQRGLFLGNPDVPGAAQSIGAFASLHTAICATALFGAHLLRAPRVVTALLWAMAVLTVIATVYFGWHYLLDDVGGLLIAALALAITRLLDGFRPTARCAA
jgi:hypothetical protein